MSFILDALRKSENARLRQEHPAMFDARPAAARRRFPAWFLGLGLLLGLNLLVLLYVLLREERGATAAPPTATVATPAATAAPGTAAAPAAATAALPSATGSTPLMTPVPQATRAAGAAVGTVSAGAGASAPAAYPATPRAYTAVPVAAPPARTRDDLVAAGDAVPEAQISLHVYDADPAKRFVFLNGQRLREGDVAADGLRVRRIDADGVVLDHRGNDFKVPLEP